MKKRRALETLGGVGVVVGLVAALAWWSSVSSVSQRPRVPTPVPTVASASPVHVTPVTRHCQMRGMLPDPTCTPGATDGRVTQENIHQTICVSGYSASVRPDMVYTSALKRQQLVEYGMPSDPRLAEEDHLISLELGGDPVSPLNLWPEPYLPKPGAHEKDMVENYLHDQVCAGNITLAAAQQAIRTDWVRVYNQLPQPTPTVAPSPTHAPTVTPQVTVPTPATVTPVPKQNGRG